MIKMNDLSFEQALAWMRDGWVVERETGAGKQSLRINDARIEHRVGTTSGDSRWMPSEAISAKMVLFDRFDVVGRAD